MRITRRRAGAAAIAGAAVVVLVGAATVGTSRGGAATPLPSVTAELDMNAVVAESSIGPDTYILAPGVGRLESPGGLCFAGTDMGGVGSFISCGDARTMESKAGVMTQRDPSGAVTVYGYVPTGTQSVEVAGTSVPLSGRFFVASVPEGVQTVTVLGDFGTQSIDVAAAPPK